MRGQRETEKYYKERASVYDVSAGYHNPVSETLRRPIKERFQQFCKGRHVLEIACGTGYWTAVIAETAASVLAIDNERSSLEQAKARCANRPNASFGAADAFKLKGVPTGFDAAFSHGFWSHISKKNVPTFLTVLHSKLEPGAAVLFNDELEHANFYRETNPDGDTLEQRTLPDGRSFMIIKNYPDEKEVTAALSPFAEDIRYTRLENEDHWEVVYKVRE